MEQPGKASLRRCHLREKPEGRQEGPHVDIWEKSIPERKYSKCKGLAAGMCLSCLRKRDQQAWREVSKAEDELEQ